MPCATPLCLKYNDGVSMGATTYVNKRVFGLTCNMRYARIISNLQCFSVKSE